MRRGVVIGLAVMASLGVLAPTAGATIRVTSTATDGLVVTDKNGTFDDTITLTLDTSSRGVQWEVAKTLRCGFACIDVATYEIGPGCRDNGSGADGAEDGGIVCDRLGGKVTVNTLGGADVFRVRASSLPITDSLTLNMGAGDDTAFGGGSADTLNGGSGADLLDGGEGGDLLDGASGEDALAGEGGADTLKGAADNDVLDPGLGADSSEGGVGDDQIALGTPARDEKDQVNGGTGFDRATFARVSLKTTDDIFVGRLSTARLTPVRIIEANLESLAGEKNTTEGDVLRSIEGYGGGFGDDILTGALSSNAGDWSGEFGDDTLFGSSAANTLVGGPGADSLDGNGGADVLDGKSGEGKAVKDPLIDCGEGAGDLAIIDLKDDQFPAGCESIDRAPAGEEPHARPRVPRRARVRRGRVSVRMACPRTQPGRCRGRLRLKVGKAGSKTTRFSIRRGGSRRVAIRLGRLQRRVGRRTVAQLVSSERGKIGPKTITRRVVLRGPGR